MATNGTKIIDGDTAFDTYWGLMDLYDSGSELEMILQEFPLVQEEYFDDFDNEIVAAQLVSERPVDKVKPYLV